MFKQNCTNTKKNRLKISCCEKTPKYAVCVKIYLCHKYKEFVFITCKTLIKIAL